MSDKYNPGVYGGSRVGFLEHEVENWIRQRVRVSNGEAVAEPVPPPPFMTIIPPKEAARRVGFTRVHVWRLEKNGRFPGRVRLIDAPMVAGIDDE
jgi:predicted DNA-binding transcriptional regulator AlpA